MNWVEEAKRVHLANRNWWINIETGLVLDRSRKEMKALQISELSEALEGFRKSKPGKVLMDDKLPQYPMAAVELVDFVIRCLDYVVGCTLLIDEPFGYMIERAKLKTNQEWGHYKSSEILFDITRQVCLSAHMDSVRQHATMIGMALYLFEREFPDLKFEVVYNAKMDYNANRADHKVENRKAAGGKAF